MDPLDRPPRALAWIDLGGLLVGVGSACGWALGAARLALAAQLVGVVATALAWGALARRTTDAVLATGSGAGRLPEVRALVHARRAIGVGATVTLPIAALVLVPRGTLATRGWTDLVALTALSLVVGGGPLVALAASARRTERRRLPAARAAIERWRALERRLRDDYSGA